jgi:HK97 family phage major capsid protein
MKDLNELRRKKAAVVASARALLELAQKEKRALTEQEATQYDGFDKEIDALTAEIAREEKLQKEEELLNRTQHEPIKPDPNDGTDGQRQAPNVTQVETRVEIRQPDGTYKQGRVINPKKEFRTLGEQLVAVVRAERAGGVVDPRLTEIRAAAGASEYVPSDGGFLVQQDFAQELLMRTYQVGEIAKRVRRIPISANANGLKINGINETSRVNGSRYGGVLSYWVNEADAATATKPKFRQIEMTLQKLLAVCYATDELLADSTALEAVIMQAFPEELNFRVEDAIINGTGAGQPLGILTSAAVVQITKEAAQVATTFVTGNAAKMFGRLWARSLANAVWLINQDVYQQVLVLTLSNEPMFIPPGRIEEAPNGALLGRPIVPVEYCATLGTAGDVILADLSQYLMIDKGGIQGATSIHVRFLNDETTFRFVYRCDGQPAWNAPLTPFKGASTQSPFITVETRS